jgi:hypothetical protein
MGVGVPKVSCSFGNLSSFIVAEKICSSFFDIRWCSCRMNEVEV